MLEEFYEAPHILRGFRESAAGPLIETLAAKLPPLGYKRDFVQRLLRGAAHLVEWSWLDRAKGEIDEQSLDLFRAHLAVCACPRGRRDRVEDQLRGARIMIDHVLGRAIARRDPIPTVLVAPVVAQFDDWMRLQRGLVEATREHYLRYVNRFVATHGDDPRGSMISGTRSPSASSSGAPRAAIRPGETFERFRRIWATPTSTTRTGTSMPPRSSFGTWPTRAKRSSMEVEHDSDRSPHHRVSSTAPGRRPARQQSHL